MEKYIPCNGNQKRAGVAIPISDKIDFKSKVLTRDKEGHYIMIKGLINQENTAIVNIYTTQIRAPKYIKQILVDVKGEIDNTTIIVGDFNTRLSMMDRLSRQKINMKRWT